MVYLKRCRSEIRLFWLLGVFLLAVSGWGYRVWALRLEALSDTVTAMPVPLEAFPAIIDSWSGQDVPIAESVQKVSSNDDFLNRLYINDSTGQWANLYIAYSGRPRTMVGHRPEVCYAAGGWIHEDSRQWEVMLPTSRKVPCMIHRFRKTAPEYAEIVVLNFYILNGRIIRSESGFSGLGWRTPNITGDAASYVAQVQISSVLENSVLTAARDFTGRIVEFFPNAVGVVGAEDCIDSAGATFGE
jgi:hypothetical protein